MPGEDLAGQAANFGQGGEIGECGSTLLSLARSVTKRRAASVQAGAAGHDDPHAGACQNPNAV